MRIVGPQIVTLEALGARAAALRAHFAGFAGEPCRRVCVATDDRATIAACILAALAGGPEVVLSAGQDETTIAAACAGADVRGAVTCGARALPNGLTGVDAQALPPRDENLSVARARDDVLLHLFTGGSTGRPASWSKTVGNLTEEALFLRAALEVGPDDVILAAVPATHIYGLLFSVYLPLVADAAVVGTAPFVPREIVAALAVHGATVFVGAPLTYKALAAVEFEAPTLRVAVSSGGFLAAADSLAFARRTGVGVTEVYGSTETGGIATRCRSAGEDEWTPFSVVQWAVGDDERLAVRSPFLSPEVPRRPDGFFVTGDRVTAGNDGHFTLHGRADGIVKVGGRRVDLDAVEAALKALPGVSDACVLALRAAEGRENTVAALVVCDRPVAALRAGINAALAPPARPRRMVRVLEIPTNALGKRDRVAALALLSGKT